MVKSKFPHYLKLTLEALFLLNFSTIFVLCVFGIFGPIYSGGGFFQSFIWGMMFKEISASLVIIAIRVFLFLSSLYFWFKKQNWLTAAYLIIAGTGAGFLALYFFAFFYLSIFGCLAVLLFCYCTSLFLKFLSRVTRNSKIQALINTWKNFWTLRKITIACAVCAAILIERFIPWEFPLFGKPLPYAQSGFGWTGWLPPYEYDISITVNTSRYSATAADIAATCAAAARYFTEKYGFPALNIHIYDYIDEMRIYDECYYLLGQCRYSPDGFYLHEDDMLLGPGWSHFQVARDIPEEEIMECNLARAKVAHMTSSVAEEDELLRKEMGYWAYRKLQPDLMDVQYELLPKNLCEKPEKDKNWSNTISRKKLVEESEALYEELKAVGASPDFPLCYKSGCDDKAYKAWVRHKYMLWKRREGNFAPEIIPFNNALDALAKAYSQSDKEKIASLTAKIDKILSELKAFKICGNE